MLRGTKVCSRHLVHMTKVAAMPIYMVKSFKNLLLQNRWTDYHKTWYVAWGLQPIKVCSNNDLLCRKVKFGNLAFFIASFQ